MNVQVAPARLAPIRSLEGTVALVTGSTSGIGLGIARALADAGSTVVLNGLGTAAQVGEVRASFESDFGKAAHYSPADMRSPDAISRMIADVAEEHGRLDDIDADQILDALSDDYMSYGDLRAALQRLYRWGEQDLQGLDELLKQLRARRPTS